MKPDKNLKHQNVKTVNSQIQICIPYVVFQTFATHDHTKFEVLYTAGVLIGD